MKLLLTTLILLTSPAFAGFKKIYASPDDIRAGLKLLPKTAQEFTLLNLTESIQVVHLAVGGFNIDGDCEVHVAAMYRSGEEYMNTRVTETIKGSCAEGLK